MDVTTPATPRYSNRLVMVTLINHDSHIIAGPGHWYAWTPIHWFDHSNKSLNSPWHSPGGSEKPTITMNIQERITNSKPPISKAKKRFIGKISETVAVGYPLRPKAAN